MRPVAPTDQLDVLGPVSLKPRNDSCSQLCVWTIRHLPHSLSEGENYRPPCSWIESSAKSA